MKRLFADRSFVWLYQAWRDELPERLHYAVQGKGVGDLTAPVFRLMDEHFLRYQPAAWDEVKADWRRDAAGRVLTVVDEWVMPAHEGVKRLGHKREVRWLRQVLTWNGLPCPCNHANILDHIGAEYGTPKGQVRGAVLRGARQVCRVVGVTHDLSVPGGFPVPTT